MTNKRKPEKKVHNKKYECPCEYEKSVQRMARGEILRGLRGKFGI